MPQPLYQNGELPTDLRVQDLISRMTLEEKAGQLTQYFYRGDAIGSVDDAERTEEHQEIVDEVELVERAIESGLAGSVLFVRNVATINRLQRLAVDQSRLGIPLLFGFDVIHGFHTVFPVPLAVAATWRPETAERLQSIAAREARAVGIHWAFAPMVDVARDPRWGRMVEGAGEDPVLGAAFASAQVRGFQGDLGPGKVIAGPKHLIGYGAARGGRDYDESDISDAELYNVYLPPFRAAVDAGAQNVMSAYMELNGVPAAANRWLITDLLRGELGFDGFVVSDANAVRSLETQHLARDLPDSALRAFSAGVDMEMTIGVSAYSHLPEAVRSGRINEALLDSAVARVLAAKFQLGLFEEAFVDEGAVRTIHKRAEHRDVAERAAAESIVLLKNDGLLPLKISAGQRVAVIGELASSKRDTLGPWIFAQNTDSTVTVLEGLRERLEPTVTVSYARGAGIPNRMFPSIFEAIDPSVYLPLDWDDDSEIDAAVRLAADADVAVIVVGQRQEQIGENASTSSLDLPGRQLEQVQRICETGTPVVVLIMSGRPLDVRWADSHVSALAQIWYPGTRGGSAVAAVLAGDVSPAARLPFTWPQHVGQLPAVYSSYRTFAPDNSTQRYFSETSTPLYPFGHGLSYASFEYSNLTIDRDTVSVGESVCVEVDVANTSDVDADEVVQLYIHQRYGRSVRPVRELKAFERVRVPARMSQRVRFMLAAKDFTYWSAEARAYVQDPTLIDIWVGGNSEASLTIQLQVEERLSS